jgi:hypothetical protein
VPEAVRLGARRRELALEGVEIERLPHGLIAHWPDLIAQIAVPDTEKRSNRGERWCAPAEGRRWTLAEETETWVGS